MPEHMIDQIHLLRYSNQAFGQTLIVVTHDERIAEQADRIIQIEDGRIVRDEIIRDMTTHTAAVKAEETEAFDGQEQTGKREGAEA